MITSYREGPLLPIEHAEVSGTLREISISAPPGAIFDPDGSVALPASAGSFSFRYSIDSQFHQSRNRFIIWCALRCCRLMLIDVRRIQGPVLDLVELSLDLNLAKNTLRLRFPFDVVPEVSFYEVTNDANPTQAKLCMPGASLLAPLSYFHEISSLQLRGGRAIGFASTTHKRSHKGALLGARRASIRSLRGLMG